MHMRGRKSQGPRYFATRKGWYTSIGGKPVLLAQGPRNDPAIEAIAQRKYHELKLRHATLEQGDLSLCGTVFEIYLKQCKVPNTRRTFGWIFKKLAPEILTKRVCDLRGHHVID